MDQLPLESPSNPTTYGHNLAEALFEVRATSCDSKVSMNQSIQQPLCAQCQAITTCSKVPLRWSTGGDESNLLFVLSTCVTAKLVLVTIFIRKQSPGTSLTEHGSTQTVGHFNYPVRHGTNLYKQGWNVD